MPHVEIPQAEFKVSVTVVHTVLRNYTHIIYANFISSQKITHLYDRW